MLDRNVFDLEERVDRLEKEVSLLKSYVYMLAKGVSSTVTDEKLLVKKLSNAVIGALEPLEFTNV
jgi:hypothetical protein